MANPCTQSKCISSSSRRLEDNSKRGARAIFFLKFFYILSVIVLVLSNIGLEITDSMQNVSVTNKDTIRRLYYLLMTDLISMVGATVVCFLMFWLFFIYLILWIHRAVKNLRYLTKTFFSPVAAVVVCTALPDIGFFISGFVLWDIARHQQMLLDERGIQFSPVTKRNLVIFLVFLILGNIMVSENITGSWPGFLAAFAVIIGIMLSWLRVLRPCVEQGDKLYQLQQEETIHAKD